jgi:tRNA dimethylallyltransferase
LAHSTKNLIVLVGPTAVGKTAVAIKLAKYYQTEILSADSRQIYTEMSIGTAKPSVEEQVLVPHHFIDTHSIREPYNAAQYGRDALEKIAVLFKRYDNLILCGGSGLYIKAVCEGFDDIPDVAQGIREDLNAHYKKNGLSWLQNKMKELDPDHYSSIDQQNPQRLMRALEVIISTGLSIRSFQSKKSDPRPFNIIKIGLTMERGALYARINNRIDDMISAGLFEEAQQLYPYKHYNALQTVGYQEIFDYIDGMYDKSEATRLLKQNSRRYAKRQLTWFMRDKSIQWFDPDEVDGIVEYLDATV